MRIREFEWKEYVSIHASPQRQGEPFSYGQTNCQGAVSIHASPQRQGELGTILEDEGIDWVSIHASPQRQGEPKPKLISLAISRRFNPRLTSAARRTDDTLSLRMG